MHVSCCLQIQSQTMRNEVSVFPPRVVFLNDCRHWLFFLFQQSATWSSFICSSPCLYGHTGRRSGPNQPVPPWQYVHFLRLSLENTDIEYECFLIPVSSCQFALPSADKELYEREQRAEVQQEILKRVARSLPVYTRTAGGGKVLNKIDISWSLLTLCISFIVNTGSSDWFGSCFSWMM